MKSLENLTDICDDGRSVGWKWSQIGGIPLILTYAVVPREPLPLADDGGGFKDQSPLVTLGHCKVQVGHMGRFSEAEKLDPLGSEVESLLAGTEPKVTPQQLLEIVTETLQKNLPSGLVGKARQNVLTFLVQTEYRYGIKSHIHRAVQLRLAGRWEEHDPYDNSDRVDALIEKYKAVAGTDDDGADEVAEIDQPVGPGALTRLHMAAMDGEYDEVVRLVEKENANPNVIDNLKKTPHDRARAFGHHRVAEYLFGKMGKEAK